MPITTTTPYPTIEQVFSLVRVRLNDTQAGATGTPGEGRIFTDNAPFAIPLLNTSIGELQRRLQNMGVTTKIKEVVLTNIPPINSSQGIGNPNPAVQQNLGYLGFFDGLLSYQIPSLPFDVLVPTIVQQRQTGSNLPFTPVTIAEEGLPSVLQGNTLGQWEWRGDAIYWNGSLSAMDARIRYLAAAAYFSSTIPVTDYPTTQVPIRDSVNALSWLIAEQFMDARLPPGASNPMLARSDKAISDMASRYTRAQQNRTHERQAFGDDAGDATDAGGWY